MTTVEVKSGYGLEPDLERKQLQAIAQAQHSVWLATYIFQTDPVGLKFVDALRAAGHPSTVIGVVEQSGPGPAGVVIR